MELNEKRFYLQLLCDVAEILSDFVGIYLTKISIYIPQHLQHWRQATRTCSTCTTLAVLYSST